MKRFLSAFIAFVFAFCSIAPVSFAGQELRPQGSASAGVRAGLEERLLDSAQPAAAGLEEVASYADLIHLALPGAGGVPDSVAWTHENYQDLATVFGKEEAERLIQQRAQTLGISALQAVQGLLHSDTLQGFLEKALPQKAQGTGQSYLTDRQDDAAAFVWEQRSREEYDLLSFAGGTGDMTNVRAIRLHPKTKGWEIAVVAPGSDNGGRTQRMAEGDPKKNIRGLRSLVGHPVYRSADLTAIFKGMFPEAFAREVLEPKAGIWSDGPEGESFKGRVVRLLQRYVAGHPEWATETPELVGWAVELVNAARITDHRVIGQAYGLDTTSTRHALFDGLWVETGAYAQKAGRKLSSPDPDRFEVVLYLVQRAFNMPVRMLPNSVGAQDLVAVWENGYRADGQVNISLASDEDKIDAKTGQMTPIREFRFEQPVQAYPGVLQTIRQMKEGSSLIVIGPSSWVVSSGATLLPKGIPEALQERKDLPVLFNVNLTLNNETVGWKASDFARFFDGLLLRNLLPPERQVWVFNSLYLDSPWVEEIPTGFSEGLAGGFRDLRVLGQTPEGNIFKFRGRAPGPEGLDAGKDASRIERLRQREDPLQVLPDTEAIDFISGGRRLLFAPLAEPRLGEVFISGQRKEMEAVYHDLGKLGSLYAVLSEKLQGGQWPAAISEFVVNDQGAELKDLGQQAGMEEVKRELHRLKGERWLTTWMAAFKQFERMAQTQPGLFDTLGILLDQTAEGLGRRRIDVAVPKRDRLDPEEETLVLRYLVAVLNNAAWFLLRRPADTGTSQTRIQLAGPWAPAVKDWIDDPGKTTLIPALSEGMLYGPVSLKVTDGVFATETMPGGGVSYAQPVRSMFDPKADIPILGVDVGGSNLKFVILRGGQVFHRAVVPSWLKDESAIASTGLTAFLAGQIQKVVSHSGLGTEVPKVVGISWPGPVRTPAILGSVSVEQFLEGSKDKKGLIQKVHQGRLPGNPSVLQRELEALRNGRFMDLLQAELASRLGEGIVVLPYRDAFAEAFGVAVATYHPAFTGGDTITRGGGTVTFTVGTGVGGYFMERDGRVPIPGEPMLYEFGRIVVDTDPTKSVPNRSTKIPGTVRQLFARHILEQMTPQGAAEVGEALAATALVMRDALGVDRVTLGGGNARPEIVQAAKAAFQKLVPTGEPGIEVVMSPVIAVTGNPQPIYTPSIGAAWAALADSAAGMEEAAVRSAMRELLGTDLVRGQRWPEGVPQMLGLTPEQIVGRFARTWAARMKAAGVDLKDPKAVRTYLSREAIPWRIIVAAGRGRRVSPTFLIRKPIVRPDGFSTSVKQAREPIQWGSAEDVVVVDAAIAYQLLKDHVEVDGKTQAAMAAGARGELDSLINDLTTVASTISGVVQDLSSLGVDQTEKKYQKAGNRLPLLLVQSVKKQTDLTEALSQMESVYQKASSQLASVRDKVGALILSSEWQWTADPNQQKDVAWMLRKMEQLLRQALLSASQDLADYADYVWDRLANAALRFLVEEDRFVDPVKVRDLFGERVILVGGSPDGTGASFKLAMERLKNMGRGDEHRYLMPVYSDYAQASLNSMPNPYLIGLLVGLSNPEDPSQLPKVVVGAKAPLGYPPYAKGNVVLDSSGGGKAIREWRDMTPKEQQEALEGFGRSLKQQGKDLAAIPALEGWTKLDPRQQAAIQSGHKSHTPTPGAQPFYHALNAGIFLFEASLVEQLIGEPDWFQSFGRFDHPDPVKYKLHEFWYTDVVEPAANAGSPARVVQLGPEAPAGLKDTTRIVEYQKDRRGMIRDLLEKLGVRMDPDAAVTISSPDATFHPETDLPRMFPHPKQVELKGRIHLETTVTVGVGSGRKKTVLDGTDKPVILLGSAQVPLGQTFGVSVNWLVSAGIPANAVLLNGKTLLDKKEKPKEAVDWLREQGAAVAPGAKVYLLPVQGMDFNAPGELRQILERIFGAEPDQIWLEGNVVLEPTVKIQNGTWLNGYHRPVLLKGKTVVGQGRSVAASELWDTSLEPVQPLDEFNYRPPSVAREADVFNSVLQGQQRIAADKRVQNERRIAAPPTAGAEEAWYAAGREQVEALRGQVEPGARVLFSPIWDEPAFRGWLGTGLQIRGRIEVGIESDRLLVRRLQGEGSGVERGGKAVTLFKAKPGLSVVVPPGTVLDERVLDEAWAKTAEGKTMADSPFRSDDQDEILLHMFHQQSEAGALVLPELGLPEPKTFPGAPYRLDLRPGRAKNMVAPPSPAAERPCPLCSAQWTDKEAAYRRGAYIPKANLYPAREGDMVWIALRHQPQAFSEGMLREMVVSAGGAHDDPAVEEAGWLIQQLLDRKQRGDPNIRGFNVIAVGPGLYQTYYNDYDHSTSTSFGASIPEHAHFQGSIRTERPGGTPYPLPVERAALDSIATVGEVSHNWVQGWAAPLFAIRSPAVTLYVIPRLSHDVPPLPPDRAAYLRMADAEKDASGHILVNPAGLAMLGSAVTSDRSSFKRAEARHLDQLLAGAASPRKALGPIVELIQLRARQHGSTQAGMEEIHLGAPREWAGSMAGQVIPVSVSGEGRASSGRAVVLDPAQAHIRQVVNPEVTSGSWDWASIRTRPKTEKPGLPLAELVRDPQHWGPLEAPAEARLGLAMHGLQTNFWEPQGFLVTQGRTAAIPGVTWSREPEVFVLDADHLGLRSLPLADGIPQPAGIQEAIPGPVLIRDGQDVSEQIEQYPDGSPDFNKVRWDPRTTAAAFSALGRTADHRLIFLSLAGEPQTGLRQATVGDMAQAMAKIGAIEAILLGGSMDVQQWVAGDGEKPGVLGRHNNAPHDAERPLNAAILVFAAGLEQATLGTGLRSPVTETTGSPAVDLAETRVAVISARAAEDTGLEGLAGQPRQVGKGWLWVLPPQATAEALSEWVAPFMGMPNVVLMPFGEPGDFTLVKAMVGDLVSVQEPRVLTGTTLLEILRQIIANLTGVAPEAISDDQLAGLEETLGLGIQL